MLAAVKNKPCGWPLAPPFLAAAARCGEAFARSRDGEMVRGRTKRCLPMSPSLSVAYPLGIQMRQEYFERINWCFRHLRFLSHMRHGIVESMDCALLMKFLSAATDEIDEMLAAITATVKEAAEKRASTQ